MQEIGPTSNLGEYENKKSLFREKLLARGYSRKEFEKASEEVDFNERQRYIAEKEKDNKIPLVFRLNYYPHITSKHIKNALLKHWEIIEDNPELRRIFPEIPIIAFSRTKNLKDDLVRARLRVSREDEEEIGPNTGNSRPGSPTLNMLQDLELESRGLNDYFLPHELFHLDPPIQSSQSQENSEEIETDSDEV